MTQEEMVAIEELKAEESKVKAGNIKDQLGWTNKDLDRYGITEEDLLKYGDRLIAAVLMTKTVSKPLEEKVPEVAKVQEEKKADDTESFSNVIDSTAESFKRKKQALLDGEGERIRGEYGAQLSDDDVIKVINIEDEMSRCKECNGKTCLKLYNLGKYKTAHWDEESKALKIVSSKCQRHMQARFNLSQIPLEYIGKTFDDYVVDTDNEYAVEVAKKLVVSPNRGVYLYGKPGTGKTFLASILAQEVIKHGRNVIFTTVPSLSAKIRSTFQKNSKLTETDILEKLYTVPTLILDDIGIEKPTRFVCSTICNIFNERYNARRQTIMTSNYPLKALENLFNNPTDEREPTLDGSRIYDRCKQMCVPIELGGKSRR